MARDINPAVREARARASQIRAGCLDYLATLALVKLAQDNEDWRLLGYEDYEHYVDAEFSEERLRLTVEMRQKVVEELRLKGMSKRAIAAEVGVSETQVRRDLAQVRHVAPDGLAAEPATATGRDGKVYPASKSPRATPEPRADSPESHGGLSSQVSESRPSVSKGPIDSSPVDLLPVPDASHGGLAGGGVPSGEFHGTGGTLGGPPRGPAPDVMSGPAGEGGVAVEGPEGDGSGGTPDDKPARPDVPGDTEPRPGPVPWDPAEREAHQRAVRRRQDIDAAHRYAGRIVSELRSAVLTIIGGVRYGEEGLVTKEMVADLRAAIDLLERELA